MEIKKFYVSIKRERIKNELYLIQTVCVIQGLSYGLCSIPDKTTLWDVELFANDAVLRIDCTQEHFDKFKMHVEELYPGLCTFGETQ